MPRHPDIQIDRARTLRRQATDAEALLWRHLRARRLDGLKFRRQHAIGPFIADLVCDECKLIVEADGGQHQEQAAADERRTAWLEARGYQVLRFWNNDILMNPAGVLEEIHRVALGRIALLNAAPHPNPLPGGERE
jgi:very-short-patch-repair endonuclease